MRFMGTAGGIARSFRDASSRFRGLQRGSRRVQGVSRALCGSDSRIISAAFGGASGAVMGLNRFSGRLQVSGDFIRFWVISGRYPKIEVFSNVQKSFKGISIVFKKCFKVF